MYNDDMKVNEPQEPEINFTENGDLQTVSKSKKPFFKEIKASKTGGVIAAVIAVLLKFKAILFLILGKLKLLFVILKFGKIFSSLSSMLFMIWIYAKMYGVAFGVGFVVLLFIHEMGHYYVAQRENLDVSTPIFIPFVGAFINMKEAPKDAVVEAKVAIGGPVLGSIGALICAALYLVSGKDFLLALAYTGFILNLFNLIPLHPLDGGRVVSAISPKIWIVGIIGMILVLFKYFNGITLIFLILGIIQAYRQWKNPNKAYYDVPFSTRMIFSILYFGLVILLCVGAAYIHGMANMVQ